MGTVHKKKISLAYHFGLFIKAAQAFLEVVSGVLFYAISTNKITDFILAVAHSELVESPNNLLSNMLSKSVNQFSVAGEHFIAFYLLSHGVVKLFIVIGLYLEKRWAYPLALLGFGGLISYQIYRLALSYSLVLFLLTIMDLIILWLIIYEHRKVKILGGLKFTS